MGDSNSKGLTLGAFMSHSNRAGGGPRKTYLKDPKAWKDNAVTVWLSTQASIYPLWRHPFQKVEVVTDRQTKESRREVWQQKLVCYEGEETLQKQYWRDKETGTRELPPLVCPHCLLVEDVRQRVLSGKLDWRQPLFRFTGSDPTKTIRFGKFVVNVGDVFIHAGGFCGLFNDKDMSDVRKKELAEIPKEKGGPVYQSSAFRQNNLAKLEYVFTVVQHDDVAAGLQVAIMPNLLGAKMQTALQHRMKSLGEEEGNPLVRPVAFRWEHNPDDQVSFDKKYDVMTVEKVRITPAIEKLVRETEPPDLSGLLEKFNWKTHRALLERHALVKLPWDSYFEEVARRFPEGGGKSERSDRNSSSGGPAPEVGRSAPTPPAAKEEEPDTFGCDSCGTEMQPTDTVCPKCGARYDVEAEEPPPPPKPPLRKRSEARAAAPAPRGNLGPVAPPPEAERDQDLDANEDDIPF
jgi:hypothetical protein